MHTGAIAYNPLSRKSKTKLLVVYDDFLMCNASLKIIANVFCRGRHGNISVAYLNQSLFHPNPFHRTISLNSTHFILLRLRNVNKISVFGKTFLPNDKICYFVSLHKACAEKMNYGYIVVYFTQTSDSKLLVRTNVVGPGYEKALVL